MKYFELDKKEKKLKNDFNQGKYKRVVKVDKAKLEYQKVAKATMQKSRNINIRLSEKDLQKIKVKAAESGIPYQTLVTSVVHRYVNEKTRADM